MDNVDEMQISDQVQFLISENKRLNNQIDEMIKSINLISDCLRFQNDANKTLQDQINSSRKFKSNKANRIKHLERI